MIPSSQSLSIPCSNHLSIPPSPSPSPSSLLGNNCQLSFIHTNILKISFSHLLPSTSVTLSNFRSLSDGNSLAPVTISVSPLPFSLNPLVLISGPSEVLLSPSPPQEVCWWLNTLQVGGRNVDYDITKSDVTLVKGGLVIKVGDSGVRVCYGGGDGDGWEDLTAGKKYELVVEATSELFGTVGSETFEFVFLDSFSSSSSRSLIPQEVSSSSPISSSQKRQQSISCEELWEDNPSSLYGVQLYPSGKVYLPSSLRSEGLTVLLKGLTPCQNSELSKELLSKGNVTWIFFDVPDLNANDYSSGTQLFVPTSILTTNFAPSIFYRVGVTFTWEEDEMGGGGGRGGGGHLTSEMSFQFLGGSVEFVLTNDEGGGAILADSPLVLNFQGSVTEDERRGLVDGDALVWSWQWGCVNPLTREICRYEDGGEVVMPTSGERFVSDGERKFEVGVPMLFVVRALVVGKEGGVSQGEWERVYFGMADDVSFQLETGVWDCLVGGNGQGYHVCVSLLFFFFHLFILFYCIYWIGFFFLSFFFYHSYCI